MNTKKLTKDERKAAKRKARTERCGLLASLTRPEYLEYKKALADKKTWIGLRKWVENLRNPKKAETPKEESA